jgi:hypothetical protein
MIKAMTRLRSLDASTDSSAQLRLPQSINANRIFSGVGIATSCVMTHLIDQYLAPGDAAQP